MSKALVPLLVAGTVVAAVALSGKEKPTPRKVTPPTDVTEGVSLPSGATVDFSDCTKPVDPAVANEWVQKIAWPLYLKSRLPKLSRKIPPKGIAKLYHALSTVATAAIPQICKPGGRYLALADQLMAHTACAVMDDLAKRAEVLIAGSIDCTEPMTPWNEYWADTFYTPAFEVYPGTIKPTPVDGDPWKTVGPEPPPPKPGNTLYGGDVVGPDPPGPPPTPTQLVGQPAPPPVGGPGDKVDPGGCGPQKLVTTNFSVQAYFQSQRSEIVALFPPEKRGCIYRLSVAVCVRTGNGAHYGALLPGPGYPILDNEGYPDLTKWVVPAAWKQVKVARVTVSAGGKVSIGDVTSHRPVRNRPVDLCPELRNAWPRPRSSDTFTIGIKGGDVMTWRSVPTISLQLKGDMLGVKITVSGLPMFLTDNGVTYADSTWITPIDVRVRARLAPVGLV